METYRVTSTQFGEPHILFEGVFTSFKDCIETAVSQNIDLSHADLSFKNLTNIELDDGFLTCANFSGSNLTGANLSEANLFATNFSYTSLFNTYFTHSDLRHSRFDYASFGATDFSHCNISDAYFTGESCFHQDFMNVQSMERCIFGTREGEILQCSEPPVVILGLRRHPIALRNHLTVQTSQTY